MKTLIIGSKGNLGQQLMEIFNYCDPIGWDREEIDIGDKKILEREITKLGPQIVINAAAYNAVDKCEESKEEFELAKKINGFSPGYLAEICKRMGTELVHYSTDYVFDGKKKQGYLESDKPNPISNYGLSKYLGERKILNRGGKYYLIRTSKLFGSPGTSKVAKKSFIDIMLEKAAAQADSDSKGKKEIEVVDDELSCFTYTSDLAGATRELVDGKKKYAYGIYHLVNQDPCTWYACAVRLFEIAGKTVRVRPVSRDKFPQPAKRPRYSVLKNTKFPQLRSWEEAVKAYLGSVK